MVANVTSPLFRSAEIASRAIWPSLKKQTKVPPSVPNCAVSCDMPSGWKDPKLTPVGLYYYIGPYHLRMERDRLFEVLEILNSVFRRLSLRTTYYDSPISARCMSLDNVELEVSIFAGRDDDDSEHELIVEVERIYGECIAYHTYAQTIMDALTADSGAEEIPEHWMGTTDSCCWNHNVLLQADSVQNIVRGEICCLGSLNDAATMLFSGRLDAQRAGLASMVHITDPYKCGLSVAAAAAECLLFPKSPQQQLLCCRLFQSALCCDVNNTNLELSNLSLVVVSQVFQVAALVQSLDLTAWTMDGFGLLHLVNGLLQIAGEMQNDPHRAYYAVQTLAALSECNPSLRNYIINSTTNGASPMVLLQEAQNYGDSFHLALATASQRLLLTLHA